MCEQVNINVSETNETINIVSSEIQEVIDINVFETTEDVTLNITEEIIQVNINKVTSAEITNTSQLINDGEDGVNPFITAADIPPVTGFVPYTGATANVDLGEYELKAGQVTLDTSPTGTAVVATTRWNDTIGTTETTLKGGSVVLKNGVDLVARVVNKVTPNTTLTKAAYQAVRISGAQGQRLAVAYAQANNDNNSADTIGIVCETIATNQEGFILTVGQLEEINTTGSLQGETWADGDVLYLSPTTAGRLTNIKPTGATGHIVVMGYVEYAHAIHGKIYVKIMNGWELDELHNVYINAPANNEGLFYDSADSLWKNETIASALGYTPQNADLFTRLRNGWEASTDFISALFVDGWQSRSSGTGAGTTISNFITGNKIGYANASTGTTITGNAGTGFANNAIGISNGQIIIETSIMIPTLSTSVERFVVFNGLMNFSNYSNPSNAIFFYYDEGGILPTATPNWKCYTIRSLTRTATITSIPVTANQWYKLKIIVNADASSVAFYIDNTLVATHTTNIPLNIGYSFDSMIQKSVGITARTMQMDYSAISQTFTTPR